MGVKSWLVCLFCHIWQPLFQGLHLLFPPIYTWPLRLSSKLWLFVLFCFSAPTWPPLPEAKPGKGQNLSSTAPYSVPYCVHSLQSCPHGKTASPSACLSLPTSYPSTREQRAAYGHRMLSEPSFSWHFLGTWLRIAWGPIKEQIPVPHPDLLIPRICILTNFPDDFSYTWKCEPTWLRFFSLECPPFPSLYFYFQTQRKVERMVL